MNQACVSLDEVLAAAAARAASLVPETSGYLALAVADATSRLPYQHDDRAVLLTVDGNVIVPRKGSLTAPPEAARGLRDLLRRLLSTSQGSMPGLTSAARVRADEHDVERVIGDIEAALIPVNRAAAKRALARLARETLRAKELGKLKKKPSQAPAAAPATTSPSTGPAPAERDRGFARKAVPGAAQPSAPQENNKIAVQPATATPAPRPDPAAGPAFAASESRSGALPPSFEKSESRIGALPPSGEKSESRIGALPPSGEKSENSVGALPPPSFAKSESRIGALPPSFEKSESRIGALPPSGEKSENSAGALPPPSFEKSESRIGAPPARFEKSEPSLGAPPASFEKSASIPATLAPSVENAAPGLAASAPSGEKAAPVSDAVAPRPEIPPPPLVSAAWPPPPALVTTPVLIASSTPTPIEVEVAFEPEPVTAPEALAAWSDSAGDGDPLNEPEPDATIADPATIAVIEATYRAGSEADSEPLAFSPHDPAREAAVTPAPAPPIDLEEEALTRPWQPMVERDALVHTPTASAPAALLDELGGSRADELLDAFRPEDEGDAALAAAASSLRAFAEVDLSPPPRSASQRAPLRATPSFMRRPAPAPDDELEADVAAYSPVPPPRSPEPSRSRWPLALFAVGVLVLFAAWLYRPTLARDFFGLRKLVAPEAAPQHDAPSHAAPAPDAPHDAPAAPGSPAAAPAAGDPSAPAAPPRPRDARASTSGDGQHRRRD